MKKKDFKQEDNTIYLDSRLNEEGMSDAMSPGLSRLVTIGVVLFVLIMLALVIGMLYVMMNGGVVVFLERLGLEIPTGEGLY